MPKIIKEGGSVMALRVHHLNCGTLRPPSAKFFNGRGGIFTRGRLVCHCLLAEARDGLILVDTGFGFGDIVDPKRIGGMNLFITKPCLDEAETAVSQVARLGFKPEDVRHIAMTHLDLDHAGGLADFPHAQVHVLALEHEAAMNPPAKGEKGGSVQKGRYVQKQWSHGPKWMPHPMGGDSWLGFDNVVEILPEVLIVPLIGHTRGHCAVGIKTDGRWLLHCGDIYTSLGQIDESRPCPLGAKWHLKSTAVNREQVFACQAKVRDLFQNHSNEVSICCSHDPDEFSAYEKAN
jgi:glyoxylase-like metal-dependent hydrolase (beta-lactamase superfamily II)